MLLVTVVFWLPEFIDHEDVKLVMMLSQDVKGCMWHKGMGASRTSS